MGYDKTNWDENTPINVPNLQKIEDGIEDNSESVDQLDADVSQLQTDMPRRPRVFNDSYLDLESGALPIVSDSNAQAGIRNNPKIYTITRLIDIPNGDEGDTHDFVIEIDDPVTVGISNVASAHVNMYSDVGYATVVDTTTDTQVTGTNDVAYINIKMRRFSGLDVLAARFSVTLIGY